MADYGIKVAKPGKDVSSTDMRDFTIHSGYNQLKILEEESATATLAISGGFYEFQENIVHNLGYNPIFMGFFSIPRIVTESFSPTVDTEYTASGSTVWYAQSFTVPEDGDMYAVSSGSLTTVGFGGVDTVDVDLFGDNSGSPGSKLLDLGDIDIYGTFWGTQLFSLATPRAVTANEVYWVVHKGLYDAVSDNNGKLGAEAGNPYSDGTLKKTTDSGLTWSSLTTDTRVYVSIEKTNGDRYWYPSPGKTSSVEGDVGSGYDYTDTNTINFKIYAPNPLLLDSHASIPYKYYVLVDPNREAWT